MCRTAPCAALQGMCFVVNSASCVVHTLLMMASFNPGHTPHRKGGIQSLPVPLITLSSTLGCSVACLFLLKSLQALPGTAQSLTHVTWGPLGMSHCGAVHALVIDWCWGCKHALLLYMKKTTGTLASFHDSPGMRHGLPLQAPTLRV